MCIVKISEKCCLCYGANNALTKTLQAKEQNKNVVLFKQLLHNKNTIQTLTNLGIVQKDNLDQITENDYVIIRAHGETQETFNYFKNNNIQFLDCTCPNVKAIQILVKTKTEQGYKIIIVGKYGKGGKEMHPEIVGISSNTLEPIFMQDMEDANLFNLSNFIKDNNTQKFYLVVQTTFNQGVAKQIIEVLQNKFSEYNKANKSNIIFDYKLTTCNAQVEINKASLELTKQVDVMLIIGGKNSSNTTELYNNVSKHKQSYFIEDVSDLAPLIANKNLLPTNTIGLTAGTSTTMQDLYEIRDYLLKHLS